MATFPNAACKSSANCAAWPLFSYLDRELGLRQIFYGLVMDKDTDVVGGRELRGPRIGAHRDERIAIEHIVCSGEWLQIR